MKISLAEFENHLREFLRDPLSSMFEGLALDLFRLQFEHVQAYRNFCEAEGYTPETVTGWTDIPAIPTTAFKEFELTAIPGPERTAVFHSSGTSEQRPSRHFHHARSLALYEFSSLVWARQHLPLDGTMLFLTPPLNQTQHSSLARMFDAFGREPSTDATFAGYVAASGGWQVDVPLFISKLRQVIDHDTPIGILGTAFNFVHLLDELAGRKLSFKLPAGSWVLETGGYKGRSRSLPQSELHGMIQEFLGVDRGRIVCEYGMSELGSQAYDMSLNQPAASPRKYRFPPWVRTQIVSPENGREVADGEVGLVRVFDLANVYSVLAIETQDLGIRQGAEFELLGRAPRAEARGCSLMAV